MHIPNVKRFYIDFIIIITLMFGFGFLPPIGPITPLGMRVVGILFACIYAWTIGSQTWPSLLALIALGFLPGNTVTSVFGSAFGNQTLLMVLFCFIFCGIVEKSGILSIIANLILTRKFAQKGPWWLAFAFYIAAWVTSIPCGGLAVTIFLWAIFSDVIEQLKIQKKSPYVATVFVGIALIAYLGASVPPYNGFTQIAIAVMTAVVPEFSMNYFAYTVFALLIGIVTIPLLILVFRLLCPKFDFPEITEIVKDANTTFTKPQKITLFAVILAAAMMMMPSLLPKDMLLYTVLSNLGVTGCMCAASILLMLIIVESKSLGDIAQAMKTAVPWDMYFLLAAALAISNMITAEGTGVSIFLRSVFSPLLSGKSMFIFMAILILASAIITNCLNNIVTLTLMIPTAMAFAGAYGLDTSLIAACFAIIVYQGLVLPSGSVMGAMLHGQKEYLTSNQVYLYATIGELVLALAMIIIAFPIGYYFLF